MILGSLEYSFGHRDQGGRHMPKPVQRVRSVRPEEVAAFE
jgi:hypothetical protein